MEKEQGVENMLLCVKWPQDEREDVTVDKKI
jgi:hypothetical protein